MLSTIYGWFLNAVGFLTASLIAGVVSAATVLGTVPGSLDGCTSGIVCKLVRILQPKPGPGKPGIVVACIRDADAQEIFRLGKALVDTRDNSLEAPLDFGRDNCLAMTGIVNKICAALGDQINGAEACRKQALGL